MSNTQVQAVAILNASSGPTARSGTGEGVRQIFQDHGMECRVEEVRAGTDVRAVARKAVEDGADVVVAGGGDGTLRAVAEALAGTSATMAILPVGTLNHFARDLEIPLDVEAAAKVAATGTPVTVDVGEVNGRLFINNAVIGLYPAYRGEREKRESQGWSNRPAILTALWALFRRYPFLTLRFSANGKEFARRTPFVLIANNEHAMEGLKPWARQRLTDGELWLYVLRSRSRLGLLRVVFKMIFGLFRARDEFDVVRAAVVRVETPRRTLRVSVDGEIMRLATPLEFRSRPRELRVMVPVTSKRLEEFICEVPGGAVSAS